MKTLRYCEAFTRAAAGHLPHLALQRVPEARRIPSEQRGNGSRSIVPFLKRGPLGPLKAREMDSRVGSAPRCRAVSVAAQRVERAEACGAAGRQSAREKSDAEHA